MTVGGTGDPATALAALRGSLLDVLAEQLRLAASVDRCTIRLPVGEAFFPVVHESRLPEAASLIGDQSVSLPGQPVVVAIREGATQVVQDDCALASADPAFQAMLASYGGLGAQIVTAVRDGGELLGLISLHHLGGPRAWSAREREVGVAGADLVARLVRPAIVNAP